MVVWSTNVGLAIGQLRLIRRELRSGGWLVVYVPPGRGANVAFQVLLLGSTEGLDVTQTIGRVAGARERGGGFRWARDGDVVSEIVSGFLSGLCREPWMTAVQAAGMTPGEFEGLAARVVGVPASARAASM